MENVPTRLNEIDWIEFIRIKSDPKFKVKMKDNYTCYHQMRLDFESLHTINSNVSIHFLLSWRRRKN